MMRQFLFFIFLLLWFFQSCKQEDKAIDLSNLEINFKPNVLWLSTEDIGCYLAVYGDSTVLTPNLDRLAAEGVVFEKAFATAGACSPSRFSIISGIHPASTSASNMRSWGRKLPEGFKYFTEYLMNAGYYCTNNSKTDYNFSEPAHETLWHETSNTAHYDNRPKDQPFFAVFNYQGTHESRFFNQDQEPLVDPDQVPVPPYYVDNKITRRDLAINYSNIKRLDDWIGEKLEQLENQGLLDSTIIFFWSDHGGPLPNQKREIYDRGTRVPLIVRFPDSKWAGKRIDELVSLMDLGPTVLSITGIPVPEDMHGRAFAGKYQQAPRKYIHTA
ncbi:MAG: sulfatase family protein, partial [Candidatus Cyclobacteriaceae bacterium M3_2C_046]